MIGQALEGIRALEFSTGIAAPVCGRYLAHHGAEVIKVESTEKPDTIRLFPSGWAQENVDPDVLCDIGPMWNDFNAGKCSAVIDLKAKDGVRVVKRLLKQVDVFLVNYSAPTMKKLGLGYEVVSEIQPGIIYISLPGFGNTPGPYRDYKVWGPNLGALAGLDHLTGWHDRPASGVGSIAYADYANAFHAFFAVLCALEERDNSGQGQFIDLAQFEATVACIGSDVLDFSVNQNVQTRHGNRQAGVAPQGVYPCRGEDRWVAISVFTDEEWKSLCQVARQPTWEEDPRFADSEGRQAHHDEVDELLCSWTSGQTAKTVASNLQRAGVPAAPVWDMADLAADPQLEANEFWKLVHHARFGKDLVTGQPIHLSDTPARWGRGGPALGEHTAYVLSVLGGLPESEIRELTDRGVVKGMANSGSSMRRPYWDWIRHIMRELEWPGDD